MTLDSASDPSFDDAPGRTGSLDDHEPPISELAGTAGVTRRLGRRQLITRQLLCAGLVLLAAPALWADHEAHNNGVERDQVVAASAAPVPAELRPSLADESAATPATDAPTANDEPVEPVAVADGKATEGPTTAPRAVADVAPVTTASPQPTTTVAVRNETEFLQCVRHRESRGDYRAVNPQSGTGGAYQFHQQTWNTMARVTNRTDLVGVRPEQASPATQDQLAHALYATEGRTPWGGYCSVTN